MRIALIPSLSVVAQQENFAAAAPFFEEACGMSERLFHDGGKIAAECRRAASMCIARQDGPDVDEGMLSTNRADIDDHLPRRAVSLIEEVRHELK